MVLSHPTLPTGDGYGSQMTKVTSWLLAQIARGVAQAELERLMMDAPPSKRQAALKRGLDALIRELR